MAPKHDPGNAERHIYGPRGLASLVPALVRPAFKRRGLATVQVLADWDAIAGPAIAAVTTPKKLFAGTLVIACSGPIAMELQHLAPTLIGRINAHLGQVAVTRLRFTQDAPPAPVATPRRRVAATEAAKRAVDGVPDGPLRDALESLGRQVLARPPR